VISGFEATTTVIISIWVIIGGVATALVTGLIVPLVSLRRRNGRQEPAQSRPQRVQQTQPCDHLQGRATHIDGTAHRALARPLHDGDGNATARQQHRQRGTGDTGTDHQHTSQGHQAQYRPAGGRDPVRPNPNRSAADEGDMIDGREGTIRAAIASRMGPTLWLACRPTSHNVRWDR